MVFFRYEIVEIVLFVLVIIIKHISSPLVTNVQPCLFIELWQFGPLTPEM